MAAYQQIVKPMPSNWLESIAFKTPNKDDKLGYIDPITRGTTFRIVSAVEDPLLVRAVRTPFDCFTREDCLGKGRGKLTVRVQLNEWLWKSLSNLDKTFSDFLVANRTKLFSASDADYIGRDNSAIRLKMKGLAPINVDGSPQTEGFITVRINGRCVEIDDMEIKDGSSGRYVGAIKWLPRTTPLPANATRISLATGSADKSGKLVIRDTLPVEGSVPVGGQRVRYVGPGDVNPKGSLMCYGLMRPAYWSIAPGGGASISLVMDTMVVRNIAEDVEAAPEARYSIPEGFVSYDEATALAAVVADTQYAAAPQYAVPQDKKRKLADEEATRAEFLSPIASSSGYAPGAPRRAATGGQAAAFSTSSSSSSSASLGRPTPVFTTDAAQLIEEQKLYEARIERESHMHKKDSAFQCTQIPEPDEDSLQDEE